MNLPSVFCWTKIGIDAGEPLESIVKRKEKERLAMGMFFWGIGHSVGDAIGELVRQNPEPEVIFSRIQSRPRAVDRNPEGLVVWTSARDLQGNKFEMPKQANIVSGFPKRRYYALVCSCNTPLTNECDLGTVNICALENWPSGKQVGFSQVTAVVRRCERRNGVNLSYPVVIRARLVAPYFLYLSDPILRDRR